MLRSKLPELGIACRSWLRLGTDQSCQAALVSFPECTSLPLLAPSRSLLHRRVSSNVPSNAPESDPAKPPEYSPPAKGAIIQTFRGHQLQLRVTGRTAKDYQLHKVWETQAEKELREEESHGQSRGVWEKFSSKVKNQVQATFLPAGYPHSVGQNFMSFSAWQFATNVAITANGVLSSAFLLYAVGLKAGAVPTAGALNWILKEGLGNLGTLLFGKTINHNFDIHSKTWYFMSSVMINASIGFELLTLVAPSYFLFIGALANTIKGLAWMAGGSTRSVFNLSFARDNNIADITAKITSQYIFSTIIGTGIGAAISKFVEQDVQPAFIAYTCLSALGLCSSYFTVKCIPLNTLNSTRLQLLAEIYLGNISQYHQMGCSVGPSYFSGSGQKAQSKPQGSPEDTEATYVNYQKEYYVFEEDGSELELPNPCDLTKDDPPLPWIMGDQRILNPSIKVGTSIEKVVQDNPSVLLVLLTTFKYSKYLMLPKDEHIHVILHNDATAKDMVQGYIQACMLRKRMRAGHKVGMYNIPELRIVLHDTLLTAEKLTAPFMAALWRQGWSTEKIVVEANRVRAVW